jgi:hypothetical protein
MISTKEINFHRILNALKTLIQDDKHSDSKTLSPAHLPHPRCGLA